MEDKFKVLEAVLHLKTYELVQLRNMLHEVAPHHIEDHSIRTKLLEKIEIALDCIACQEH